MEEVAPLQEEEGSATMITGTTLTVLLANGFITVETHSGAHVQSNEATNKARGFQNPPKFLDSPQRDQDAIESIFVSAIQHRCFDACSLPTSKGQPWFRTGSTLNMRTHVLLFSVQHLAI